MKEELPQKSFQEILEEQKQIITAQQNLIKSLETHNQELRKQLVITEQTPASLIQKLIEDNIKKCLTKGGKYPPEKNDRY